MKFEAVRYHDICCGHRVVGHEGKCRNLHGHNYRVYFHCEPASGQPLDSVGRVVDFSVIKTRMCHFIEETFDHRMLIWAKDPDAKALLVLDPTVVLVPFNPTAENMAAYLLAMGEVLMSNTGAKLVKVVVEETAKCSASVSL